VGERRILLVEDEATTREILTLVLRGAGYQVDSVASAGAAATCLRSIPYALVIADWMLPDGNGLDVADHAAQLGSKTLIVSSFMSGLPPGADARHEFLAKQLGPAEIVVAARRAIGGPAAKP
jgi:DNA-binding response OmpR family regulator